MKLGCGTVLFRQYELENFVFNYNAYRALRGNSFIEKINSEVMNWRVIT